MTNIMTLTTRVTHHASTLVPEVYSSAETTDDPHS